MADTVEGLVIEIESNAGSAGSQLDALAAKLENLKRVVGSSTPLKTFSKNYAELMVSINSHGVDASKLEGLSAFTQFVNQLSNSKSSVRTFSKNYEMMVNSINALQVDASKASSMQSFVTAMSGVSNIKISSTITKQLDNLNFVIQNINVESVSGLESMINALAKLSAVNGIKISTSITNQLERIAELAKNIQGYDFTKLSELTAAISQLGALSGISGENVSKLVTSVKQFSNATKSASSRGRTFNTVLANIRTRTLLLVRATQMIRRATTQALGVYGDYIETLNLFKMAMGSAGEEAYEFAEKAQSLLGIDLTQWMKAQGVFNALASGFGVAGDRAAIMSKNLTQLAYDISSFYNIDVDTAVEKVRSGFSGQIRPVRDLGYDLSQARLEAIALSMGIDKSVKSMTQAEKSQLRYIALMTQLTQVQGDLARTLDSPINQMRILQAQLQQMYRSIGMTLLPILNKVLPYLNAILRVIKMIADEIAAMFGYTLPRISGGDWSSSVVMGAEDIEEELENATGAAEKLKNTLASFDQINLISSSSGGSGSGAGATGGGGGFDFDLPEYDFLGDAAENRAQEIAESMRRKLDPFVRFIKETIQFVIDHIDEIKTLLETLAVITIGKKLIDSIQGAWKWFTDLKGVVSGIGLITIGVSLSYLGGENLAKGNILTGILESALGAAASAYGGKLIFDTVGLGGVGIALGIGLSLLFTIKGFEDQKYKDYVKIIRDIAYDFDESRGSVEDFVKAWNTFADGLTTPAFTEAFPEGTIKEIQEAATSLDQLRTNYTTGLISATAYTQGLSLMFGQLKDSILKYAEESTKALNEMLEGSYGNFLQTHQLSTRALSGAYTQSMNNVTASFSAMQMQMDMLNTQFQLNLITEDEMTKKTDELLKSMTGLVGETNLTSEAVKTFSDFTNGLNFVSMNNVLDTLTQIDQKYADTYGKLTKEKLDLKSMLEYGKQNAIPELQGLFDNALALTDEYYKGQFQKLEDEYRVGMGVVENTINDNLLKVFNKEGIDGVTTYFIEDMAKIREAISESYSSKHLDPNNSFYSEFDKLIQKTREAFEKMGWDVDEKGAAAVLSLLDSNKDIQRAYEDLFGTYRRNREKDVSLTDDYVRTLKGGLGKFASSVKESTKEINYNLGGSGEYVNGILANLPISAETRMSMMNSVIKNKGFAIGQNTKGIANDMVNTISKMDLPNEMQRVLARAQDMIKPADFGLKGASVTKNFMDNFKKDFTPIKTVEDFKTKFSSMFQGDDAKKWGVKFGQSVKEGMDTGLSGAETGVENALKGAKTVLDQFGSASASYWSQMSKNIATVMSAIVANPTNPALKSTLSLILSGMKWTMKGFAKGGFPDSADFFYANENGVPEYIGTMGGRTAVANNTEIAKGIADAVVKAIRDTGIASDVKKIASKDGKVVFAPSEEAGRVMAQSVNMYNSTGGRY